jgi:hypothetical protein
MLFGALAGRSIPRAMPKRGADRVGCGIQTASEDNSTEQTNPEKTQPILVIWVRRVNRKRLPPGAFGASRQPEGVQHLSTAEAAIAFRGFSVFSLKSIADLHCYQDDRDDEWEPDRLESRDPPVTPPPTVVFSVSDYHSHRDGDSDRTPLLSGAGAGRGSVCRGCD